MAVDILVAVGAVGVASETGSGSAGDVIGWTVIGLVAPLGLRSPVYKDRELFGRQVDVGFTYVYDIGRTFLVVKLDQRMAILRIQRRSKRLKQIKDRGWTYGSLLVFIEHFVEELHLTSETEKESILTKAYLPRGFEDDDRALSGLVKVVIDYGTAMADHPCRNAPSDTELTGAADAEQRARHAVRREELGIFPEPTEGSPGA